MNEVKVDLLIIREVKAEVSPSMNRWEDCEHSSAKLYVKNIAMICG